MEYNVFQVNVFYQSITSSCVYCFIQTEIFYLFSSWFVMATSFTPRKSWHNLLARTFWEVFSKTFNEWCL